MADDETIRTGSLPRQAVHERTAVVGALAVAAILIAGWAVPDFQPGRVRFRGLPREEYWRIKMNWHGCADVVLAGDSRIQVGLSPGRMGRRLPGKRIYNYGFGGVGYSEKYLHAVEAMLDPASGERIIVLGISPAALLKISQANNIFLERLRKKRAAGKSAPAERSFWQRNFPACRRFFQPKRGLRDVQLTFGKSRQYMEFFADGWLATREEGDPNPRGESRKHRRMFMKHQVDRDTVERFLAAVRRWSGRGIRVYGFRAPTNPANRAMEDELSGLNAGAFSAAFAQAGGVWLRFDEGTYTCYDGTHLDRSSAERFSEDLARKIQHEHAN